MDWNSIQTKLKACNHSVTQCKFKDAVTTSMPRTFLLGNGDIAAISNGGNDHKEFLISKGDFWSCGDLKTNVVMSFDPKRVTPLTIGSIRIDNLSASNDFHETLDISCGVLKTKYDDTVIEAFCHSLYNAVIIKIKSAQEKTVSLSFSAKSDVPEYPADTVCRGGVCYATRSTANFAPEHPRSWTSRVAVAARALGDTELVFDRCGSGTVSCHLSLKADQAAVVCIAVSGGGKTYDNNNKLLKTDPIDEAKALLKTIPDYSEATKSHQQWWREYWCKSSVSLSDLQLEDYYYGSLYLMACCSRQNKLAPGIFGNFITTDNPKWNGDFHMNYNFIAPFYGMYAANRAEFAKPLKDPVIDFIPEGKQRAQEDITKISPKYIKGGRIGGIKHKGREDIKNGIDDAVLYPVALGPFGVYTWSDQGGYLTQMNDCAFTCMGITAYYFYTLDRAYFCQIEELLRLNVNFFLRWCEKEELGGNRYRYNVWSGAHEGSMELNSPHVLASIKNILKCLLDGYERGYSDQNAHLTETWADFLHHLADYPIRRFSLKKILKKRFDDEVIPLGEKGLNVHRNAATVSLEFIHPGEELNFTSDERLKRAARNLITVHKTMNPDIYRQVNNLPKIFIHGIRAEYDPLVIVNEFKRLYDRDFMVNYSVQDFGDTHGIEKAGGIEFINSMLLASDMQTVKVFPNWLMNQDAAFEQMLARGAFLVSASYNGERHAVDDVKITSQVQDEICLISPWDEVVVLDAGGNHVAYTVKSEAYAKKIICVAAKLHEEYTFLPGT